MFESAVNMVTANASATVSVCVALIGDSNVGRMYTPFDCVLLLFPFD
jgi:hypothetical protein